MFELTYFFENIQPHCEAANGVVTRSHKMKRDEYLLFDNKFNVKFTGDSSLGFDVKELKNPDCNPIEGEKWVTLCKGQLGESTVDALIQNLEALATSNGANSAKIKELAHILSTSASERVVTKKQISTLKIVLASGFFVVEQIDFSMWRPSRPQKRLVMRSISLEGPGVPATGPGSVESVMHEVSAKYPEPGRILFGGFPSMLAQALKMPGPDGGGDILRVFELVEVLVEVESECSEPPALPTYIDRQLQCVNCQTPFVFSAAQQEFFAKRRYSDPVRCSDCSKAKKDKNMRVRGPKSGNGNGGGATDGDAKSGGDAGGENTCSAASLSHSLSPRSSHGDKKSTEAPASASASASAPAPAPAPAPASASAPAPAPAPAAAKAGNKTVKPCFSFQKGECKRGDKCQDVHTAAPGNV